MRLLSKKLDLRHGKIEMAHGGGGKLSAQLVEELFLPAFNNPILAQLDDQAALPQHPGQWVMASDSHVVSPLFFPGGDIGSLSVNGTVNDVAMAGAKPLYMSACFILEEGFPLADLHRIVLSMAAAAQSAGVAIVTGDTKVVESGKGDGVFITTTGVGIVPPGVRLSANQARPGDRILLSGTLGDHGMAILTQRQSLGFSADIQSDTVALHDLVAAMITVAPDLRCLRDPTRGGLSSALNELARQSVVGMHLWEHAIPIREPVRAVCELLGLDPLFVANEGKLIAICPAEREQALLDVMRAHPLGRDAACIGEVVEDSHCFVEMETTFGGRRMVDWIVGEQLPRIC